MDDQEDHHTQYAENAVRRIQDRVGGKKVLPEIDFTLHTMEDGSTVSTQERVCKGTANNPWSEEVELAHRHEHLADSV